MTKTTIKDILSGNYSSTLGNYNSTFLNDFLNSKKIKNIYRLNSKQFSHLMGFLKINFVDIKVYKNRLREVLNDAIIRLGDFHDGFGGFTETDETRKGIRALMDLVSEYLAEEIITESVASMHEELSFRELLIITFAGNIRRLPTVFADYPKLQLRKLFDCFFDQAHKFIEYDKHLATHGELNILNATRALEETCLKVEGCAEVSIFENFFHRLGKVESSIINSKYKYQNEVEALFSITYRAFIALFESRQFTEEEKVKMVYVYFKATPNLNHTTVLSACQKFNITCDTESTETDTVSPTFYDNSLIEKAGIGFASGFIIGSKNASLDHLCILLVEQAKQKDYSGSFINGIKALFLLTNVLSTAALPYCYAYISKFTRDFEETDNELTATQLLTSASICLIADVLFKFSYQCFSETSKVRKILNYVNPFFAFTGMWATANSLTEGATVYGATAVGGLFGNSLIQLAKSSYFSNKKNAKIPYTSKEIEMILSGRSPNITDPNISTDLELELNTNDTSLETSPFTSQESCNEPPIYARPLPLCFRLPSTPPVVNNESRVPLILESPPEPIYDIPSFPAPVHREIADVQPSSLRR